MLTQSDFQFELAQNHKSRNFIAFLNIFKIHCRRFINEALSCKLFVNKVEDSVYFSIDSGSHYHQTSARLHIFIFHKVVRSFTETTEDDFQTPPVTTLLKRRPAKAKGWPAKKICFLLSLSFSSSPALFLLSPRWNFSLLHQELYKFHHR